MYLILRSCCCCCFCMWQWLYLGIAILLFWFWLILYAGTIASRCSDRPIRPGKCWWLIWGSARAEIYTLLIRWWEKKDLKYSNSTTISPISNLTPNALRKLFQLPPKKRKVSPSKSDPNQVV